MNAQEASETAEHRDPTCSICQEPLVDPSRSTYKGSPVHDGCFGRRRGRHDRRRKLGRALRRLVPAGKLTKPFLRKEGWVKRRGAWERAR